MRSQTAFQWATRETLAQEGFVGAYWAPTTPARQPHAAVLLFGGSEGGLDGTLLAGTLAGQGYPTLDVAYFKEPGLPQSLTSAARPNAIGTGSSWARTVEGWSQERRLGDANPATAQCGLPSARQGRLPD